MPFTPAQEWRCRNCGSPRHTAPRMTRRKNGQVWFEVVCHGPGGCGHSHFMKRGDIELAIEEYFRGKEKEETDG